MVILSLSQFFTLSWLFSVIVTVIYFVIVMVIWSVSSLFTLSWSWLICHCHSYSLCHVMVILSLSQLFTWSLSCLFGHCQLFTLSLSFCHGYSLCQCNGYSVIIMVIRFVGVMVILS